MGLRFWLAVCIVILVILLMGLYFLVSYMVRTEGVTFTVVIVALAGLAALVLFKPTWVKNIIGRILTGMVVGYCYLLLGILFLISQPTYYIICLAEAMTKGFPPGSRFRDYTFEGLREKMEKLGG